MAKKEIAEELFSSGLNCAMAVLASFCDDYDIDTETAMKIASGLGGGCAEGEICGAACAAVLVVGLKYGWSAPGDQGARANCHARTVQIMDTFRQNNGAVTCRDLLADAPKGTGDEDVKERRRICTGFVKSAVEILEDLGY